jgi:pimeloyl-ACP methyl ester carboxylesterase
MTAVHHLGGSGRPVLFCHATGFHARVWDPIAAALGDDFDCWAIDMRGHGDSLLPQGTSLAWTGMSDDVLATVDHLATNAGIDTPMLAVGHSMGGAALMMAELVRPGTFSHGYLYEPVLFPPITEGVPTRSRLSQGALKRREMFDSFDAAYERYSSRPPLGSFDPRSLRSYVDHGFRPVPDGVMLKCRGAVEAEVFDNSDNRAYLRLGEISTRVLVAAGREEDGPAMIAPAVADCLRHGSLHIDKTLSHFGPMEQPGLLAERIADHFTS